MWWVKRKEHSKMPEPMYHSEIYGLLLQKSDQWSWWFNFTTHFLDDDPDDPTVFLIRFITVSLHNRESCESCFSMLRAWITKRSCHGDTMATVGPRYRSHVDQCRYPVLVRKWRRRDMIVYVYCIYIYITCICIIYIYIWYIYIYIES